MFKFSNRASKFERIENFEDNESLLESAEKEKFTPRKSVLNFRWIASIFLTFAASTAFGVWLGKNVLLDRNKFCIKQISQPSPIIDDISLSFQPTEFNGSFAHKTIFRQSGSPEVDAAWESLGVDYDTAIIPLEDGYKAGLTDDHVQIQEKYGGGFLVNVEGLHHLHCLNLVRQSLYYNFDYYSSRKEGAFVNEGPMLQMHVSHCLDILRQQLMCTVDMGILGQVWWNKDNPTAFPDFNTKHTCRNYDAVRQWGFEHQAQVPVDWLVPPRDLSIVSEEMP